MLAVFCSECQRSESTYVRWPKCWGRPKRSQEPLKSTASSRNCRAANHEVDARVTDHPLPRIAASLRLMFPFQQVSQQHTQTTASIPQQNGLIINYGKCRRTGLHPIPPTAIIRQHYCQMSANLLISMHFILHLTPTSMPDFPLPQCGETEGLASSRQRECETCRC